MPNRTHAIRFAGAATALLFAACTSSPQAGSAAPSGSVPPSPPASQAPSPSTAPAPSVFATPLPSVAPSPTPSTLPEVGAAPTGPWSTVSWISAGGVVPLGPSNVSVRGWSGGYVALQQTGGSDENGNDLPVVIQASASSDGLQWSAPTTLDTKGFVGNIEISSIVEGPSGLLAIGYPYGDTCGGPPVVVALWSSADGRAWHRVTMPKDFKSGSVNTIAGGSAGFIARGSRADGTTPAIWTSPDGQSWTSRPLPKVSSGTLVIDGAASFAGGFVVAGAVLGEDGCGGPAHIHAATWWSADGTAWTRATLPGSMTAANAYLALRALSDRSVLVTQTSPDGSKLLAWTSADGRSWTPVDKPTEQTTFDPVTDGRHAALMVEADSGIGAPTIFMVGEDAGISTLGQSGSGPMASEDGVGWTFAVGPTGVLVVGYDGRATWLGVPG